jgi:hypothetical protein
MPNLLDDMDDARVPMALGVAHVHRSSCIFSPSLEEAAAVRMICGVQRVGHRVARRLVRS